MKSQTLLLSGPRRLIWTQEDLPALKSDDLLLETRAGAISIGSELPQYCGTARRAVPSIYPYMTGYENVGVITACGAGVQRQVGDRVIASYGHRSHAVIPAHRVMPVPDHISDQQALLAILSCDAAKGVRKAMVMYDEAVLITGAGTIGLLTIFMLKALGVEQIDVIEPYQPRRELAMQLGATSAHSPEHEEDLSPNYTAAFECSSRNEAFALLQSKLQPSSRICILADGNLEPLILTPDFHQKELHILGSSDGWNYQKHTAWYFNLLRGDTSALEAIFDYEISQDDLIATFDQIATGSIRPTKVFVHYRLEAQFKT